MSYPNPRSITANKHMFTSYIDKDIGRLPGHFDFSHRPVSEFFECLR